jgi:hypothetical protein
MKRKFFPAYRRVFLAAVLWLGACLLAAAQQPSGQNSKDKPLTGATPAAEKSIGGKEHEANVLGVRIGMDVPTALETVFVNGKRKPGQEKPDGKRNEGKDNKDIRVIYKGLEIGELQIVFAGGRLVKEMVLVYSRPPLIDDLRLPFTSNIGEAIDGNRYDDRYTVGFTEINKQERTWWRDEKAPEGYRVRVQFISDKNYKPGSKFVVTVVRKIVGVTPGDEGKFTQAMPQ